ncbi:MAG: 50S ribosomal protein L29 [Candidatus Paceibacterota bacterium]
MKSKEIRQKNKEQIIKLVIEQREKLKELAFGRAGSKEKNVKLTKTLKKGIARLLTILNETVPVPAEKKEINVETKKAVVKAKKVATKK